MIKRIIAAAAVTAAVFGLSGMAASAATAHARPTYTYGARPVSPLAAVHTATTVVQLRPDSGNHGYWALDDLTRTITLTRHEPVAPGFCGTVATQCFYYTYVIKDSGVFTVQQGALSPQAGTAEDLTERGSITGGTATGWLFSSWKRAYVSGVPTAENDNGVIPAGLHTTSLWAEQFFGPAAHFGTGTDAISLGNWSWSYTVPAGADSQCPAGHWSWVDAASNSDGSLPADGDIRAPVAAHCAAQS